MCAITAGLTGATLTPVHGYRAKLAAAQQHSLRVIVASDAHATAREQAPQEYGDHIHDAHDVTEAVARARTRFNPAPWTVTVVAMLTVLVTVLSITHVIGQRLDDVAARVESTSRLYANIARTSAAADPALAQQIALAAYRLAPTPDARSALLETSAGAPLRITPATGFGPVSLDDAPRLAATPDGRFLAVGGHDGLVHLVSVADGAIRRLPPIRTDSGTIRALALSADRRWLVVAGDRESALWDLAATPRRAATLPADRRPPWSVAISPDTRMIALGTRDGHIFTWTRTDTDTDSLIPAFPTLTVAAGQRTSVALSDRALAAAVPSALTGTWTTTLRTWDTTTLDPAPVTDLRVERPDGAQARTLQFDTAGTVLALGLNPGAILRWRLTPTATMDPLPGLDRPGADFLDISLDGDARRAAIVGADSTVRVVDLDTGATTTTVRVATPARALITGAALLTSSLDRSIQLHRPWAALTPTTPLTLYRFPHRHTPPPGLDVPALPLPRAGLAAPEPTTGDPEGFIDVVATSPDNRRAATRTAHAIQLWDTTDPTLARPLGPPLPSAGVDVAAIVFASDNTLAIGRGLTSTVELWDATGPGEPVQRATLRFGRGYPTSLAYSPDGHTLAVGSYLTGVVRVYDLRTSSSAPPSIDLPPIDARGETMTLALNPEAILAVGVRAGLHVYDTTARPAAREIALPGGGLDAVNAVAFDDSGTRLAASTTTSLHLWDLTDPDHPSSYATLARAPIHWKPAMLSFDSTGQTLTESATDATLRHWNTDAQTLASRICANGATPITPDEWRRALPGTTPVDTCPP